MKKRGFGNGKWNGAGGKAESNETPLQAAIRECQEEIGVTPQALQLIGKLDFYDKADPNFNHYSYVYISNSWLGKPVETEEMRPQWFDVGALPYNDMWTADVLWMPYVLDDQCFEGTITADGEALAAHDIKQVETLS